MAGPGGDGLDASGEALPNVGEVPLAYALRAADAALDHAIKRVLDDIEDVAENYAAFGNAV